MSKRKPTSGYKAYEKGLVCKGFKFEEGKTYKTDKAKVCDTGFHLCINPLDCLNYYNLYDSEFTTAEAIGKIDTHKEDSKIATTKIRIGAKLSLKAFIEASINFLLSKKVSKRKAASGYSSKLAASGYYSQLAASGNYSQLAASGHYSKLAASGGHSQLAASGYSSKLELNGFDSVGAAIGHQNTIKGKKGNWITLAEWKRDESKNRYVPICVKSALIEGVVLKEDTWYELKN